MSEWFEDPPPPKRIPVWLEFPLLLFALPVVILLMAAVAAWFVLVSLVRK